MPVIVKRRNVPRPVETEQGETEVPFDPETGERLPDPATGIHVHMPPPSVDHNHNAADGVMTRAEFDLAINAERERVRQEEKNKLYPQIEELKGTVDSLTEERTQRLAAEEAERERLAEEHRLAQEAEMTAQQRLEAYQGEQDRRFAALEADRARDQALLEREREFNRIEGYLNRRKAEEAANETIAPQFMDYVGGANEEQIEQSIAKAVGKTAELLEEFREMQGQQQQVRRTPLVPVTGQPPTDIAGGFEGQQERVLTAEEIRDMPMNEYREYRDQLLGAASRQVSERGLYG